MTKSRLYALTPFLLFALTFISTADLFAQRRRADTPLNNRREISPDSLKGLLRSMGTEGAFNELIKRRVDQQLRTLENSYISLEFNPDSISRIVTDEIQQNSELVASLIVDIALGRGFSMPVFSRQSIRFDGSLSSPVERELFELQWITPNKAPLFNIKSRRNDFDPDLEQILVNEVQSAGLAEPYFRDRIYRKAQLHLNGRFVFALTYNDDFAEQLGRRLQTYLLNNLKTVLSRKNVSELLKVNGVVERFQDNE